MRDEAAEARPRAASGDAPQNAGAGPAARLTVRVPAFGLVTELEAPAQEFLVRDTLWRLRELYGPALAAAAPLPARGLAVDIGAGFGGFALPFASAFPGWTVWCFEPEPEAFAALEHNIRALGLPNVRALPLGIGAGQDAEAGAAALARGELAALAAAAHMAPFRRPADLAGYLEAGEPRAGEVGAAYPVVPAAALAALAPTLVKLVAPGAEAAILAALSDTPVEILLGETWAPVPAALAYGRAGARLAWLPVAGDALLRLGRVPARPGRREGLDVVVPAYNARAFVGDCVAAILAGADDAVRVIVIDDGSTDGTGEALAMRFADDARVRVHVKENGGCASARNRGRMLSDATHIAFADADDLPGPGLYAGLLELARYTGAEVVQGGFALLHAEADGGLRAEPSYEAGLPEFARLAWRAFAGGRVAPVPAELLMIGQPTIWRRVYRRDFLDAKDIWFPEHIRAFDDLMFQHLTLAHARSVPMAEHLTYGYRQHPGQDIRQGDERAFYALEMFRLLARRALAEGWMALPALLRSYANTVGWSWGGLRPDLRPRFAAAAAELWAVLEGALGAEAFAGLGPWDVAVPGFTGLVRAARRRVPADAGAALVWLDAPDLHVPLVRAAVRRETGAPG